MIPENEMFVIARLHRDDIDQAFEGRKTKFKGSDFDDEDMRLIARKMAEGFLESGVYWDALREIAEAIKEEMI